MPHKITVQKVVLVTSVVLMKTWQNLKTGTQKKKKKKKITLADYTVITNDMLQSRRG